MQKTLKHKQTNLFITILMALTIVGSLFFVIPQEAAAQTSPDYYSKSYAWDYDGRHWTWDLNIPKTLYDAYKAVPVSTRVRNGPAGYGFLTTTDDYYVRMLAQKLNQTTSDLGYGSYDQVSFVLAFVQSLLYTSDSVTTGYDEYPRFPIETLVDDGGDCEDSAILFATITLIMGYGTIYINPPNHYAVGVLGTNLRGACWEYPEGSNETYYYCETTGDNFKIGQLPAEFTGKKAYLYSIDQNTQFIPKIMLTAPTQMTPTAAPSAVSTGAPQPTVTDDMNGPTVQPVMPLSFNLIAENPALFVIIAFVVAACFVIVIWSIRRPRSIYDLPEFQALPDASSDNARPDTAIFCVFCGTSNKDYAVFCGKCGKRLS